MSLGNSLSCDLPGQSLSISAAQVNVARPLYTYLALYNVSDLG
jgi:hypothetical protein